MEEALCDPVADPVDGEFSLNPGNSGALESNEMATPHVNDYSENYKHLSSGILNVKILDRIGSSELASASPHCVDDNGVTVEELMLKNYDGEKLTIVGTSTKREASQTRRNQWQNLHQVSGESRIRNLHWLSEHEDKSRATSCAWEDRDKNLYCDILDKKRHPHNGNHGSLMTRIVSNDTKGCTNMLYTSGTTKTRFSSKSGFSEYLKSTMRGKGVLHKDAGSRGPGSRDQGHPICGIDSKIDSALPFGSDALADSHLLLDLSEPSHNSKSSIDGVCLRDWLEKCKNKTNKAERMHIFKQVLELVDLAHSRGDFVQDLRPSFLKLSGSYQILHVGSSIPVGISENATDQDIRLSDQHTQPLGCFQNEKKSIHGNKHFLESHFMKKRKLCESLNFVPRWTQSPSKSCIRSTSRTAVKACNDGLMDCISEFDQNTPMTESINKKKFFSHGVPDSSPQLQASVSCKLEEKWYAGPELLNENGGLLASNIYSLGVLLFELQCSFDSGRSHTAAMLDLRNRILPPRFLSESSKEAGFCLWLLHPDPSSRPTSREILQSEFLKDTQEHPGEELSSYIDEEEENSESLLSFLSSLNERKKKWASNLLDQIQCIETDIEEIDKRRTKKSQVLSSFPEEKVDSHGSDNIFESDPRLDALSKETKFLDSIKHLENAYFSMRSNIQLSDNVPQRDVELLKSRINKYSSEIHDDKYNMDDCLGAFFDGLCKYARYSKFKVQGIMRSGEYINSPNVICTLSFDRDEDFLAAGGVSKKIKIFGFQSLFNDSVDIHYPILEMANKSKLSCIGWNSYISNYLASTDYDGIVKLWDVTTGQEFCHFSEHTERAWSVDFSRVDPLKLASGSDDRFVKIWSINEKKSSTSIKNHANVCSVQFSSESAYLLAFSSADYKTYCYDLRNVSTPWCVLAGHEKAVSYIKFLDAGTIISASTDNTLKIWDLNKTSSNSISRNACALTLRGHTNEKNFVGLSVADGYIACGSETNEVFAYYRSLPMPITCHRFGSVDSMTGKETEDSNGQFVSSVCWRQKSNLVVAANSSGCIKLLQMV